jgi:hypothetical protein
MDVLMTSIVPQLQILFQMLYCPDHGNSQNPPKGKQIPFCVVLVGLPWLEINHL